MTQVNRRGAPPALRFAAERCLTCLQQDECDRLLAAGQDEKIGAFCPNAMYLRRLDAMQNHAPQARAPRGRYIAGELA